MSRKDKMPDYIVIRVKKFYAHHEICTDPIKVLDDLLDYLMIHEGIQKINDDKKLSILESMIFAGKRDPKPENNVEKFHRYTNTAVKELHKMKIW